MYLKALIMAIKFFYLPKGRKFNYQPRYYDERKEELERRKRRIDRELGLEQNGKGKDVFVPQIKGQMRKYMKTAKKQRKTSNIRMLIILAVLLLISYFLLMV